MVAPFFWKLLQKISKALSVLSLQFPSSFSLKPLQPSFHLLPLCHLLLSRPPMVTLLNQIRAQTSLSLRLSLFGSLDTHTWFPAHLGSCAFSVSFAGSPSSPHRLQAGVPRALTLYICSFVHILTFLITRFIMMNDFKYLCAHLSFSPICCWRPSILSPDTHVSLSTQHLRLLACWVSRTSRVQTEQLDLALPSYGHKTRFGERPAAQAHTVALRWLFSFSPTTHPVHERLWALPSEQAQDLTLLTSSPATTPLQATIFSPKDRLGNLLTGIPVTALPLWSLPHTTARGMLLKPKVDYVAFRLKPSNAFPFRSVKVKILP